VGYKIILQSYKFVLIRWTNSYGKFGKKKKKKNSMYCEIVVNRRKKLD